MSDDSIIEVRFEVEGIPADQIEGIRTAIQEFLITQLPEGSLFAVEIRTLTEAV